MKNLPVALLENLNQKIRQMGDPSSVQTCVSLGGGCIHQAVKVETLKNVYMLKWNLKPLPEIFQKESSGLKRIRETSTVRVPEVYHVVEDSAVHLAYILMEWIEPPGNGSFDQEMLGRQLAAMHQVETLIDSPIIYGLDEDNYIGKIEQKNSWHVSWIEFFRENRLLTQMDLAEKSGRLPAARRKGLDYIVDHLDVWLENVIRTSSLLHGDLWGGNVITGKNTEPVLLDPAVYYGDREIELAFTELFGGFDDKFYAAYQEVWPLESGYEIRKHLYNLYHLLNHLNHFGETYGGAVDRTISRFYKTS